MFFKKSGPPFLWDYWLLSKTEIDSAVFKKIKIEVFFLFFERHCIGSGGGFDKHRIKKPWPYWYSRQCVLRPDFFSHQQVQPCSIWLYTSEHLFKKSSPRFPGLSRTWIRFLGFSRPGKQFFEIQGLSRNSRTCTNPVFCSTFPLTFFTKTGTHECHANL